ncbi:MAG TPA: hypothetical protein VEI01_11735 [Terriglobales bacterium]|nr:hypothetical protein [Terriglobales bacterium]
MKLSASFLLAFVLLATTVVAQTNAVSDSKPCSLTSLKGTYGVLEQGTIVGQVPGFPPNFPPPYPIVLAASATYDGAGNLSGTFKISIGGVPLTGTFTGTYTVSSDCIYVEKFLATPPGIVPLHDSGIITGNGIFREIHYIYTDSDRVISGTAKKTPPGGCSVETVKGKYAVFGQGTIVAPGLASLMAAHVGLFTAHRAGRLSGSEFAIESGGPAAYETFTANADVSSDCTVSLVINDSEGLVVHEWGSITGEGRSQEFNGIVTDPGWVFVENVKKQ